jgi:CDP-paratose 2-epimerase
MGSEDQGWVAWFMIAAHLGLPITIYGDGKQVRDVLFIDDVLNAYEAAFSRADEVSGRAFNIGGGPSNTLSLFELVDFVKDHQHHALPHSFRDWRPGDQKVFVSDIRRAQTELGWSPQVSTSRGLSLLYRWVSENQGLFHELESEVESTSRR